MSRFCRKKTGENVLGGHLWSIRRLVLIFPAILIVGLGTAAGWTPPFTNASSYHNEEVIDTWGLYKHTKSVSNIGVLSGNIGHVAWVDSGVASGIGFGVTDEIYSDFTVPTSGNYLITYKGIISGGFWNLSAGPLGYANGGGLIWLETKIPQILGARSTSTLYETDLSNGALLDDLTRFAIEEYLDIGDYTGAIETIQSLYNPEFSWDANTFSMNTYVFLEAGKTYQWSFSVGSRTFSLSLGLAFNTTTFDVDVCLEEVSVVLQTGIGNDPVLYNPRVSPQSGTTVTSFEYLIDYYDVDGDSPDYVRVYIDGSQHDMTLKSGTPASGTYRYTTNLREGEHSYYFTTLDGHDSTSVTDLYYGPSVSSIGENHGPQLTNPGVNPISGTASTNFEFLVDYYDADNDPPHPDWRKVYISGDLEGNMMLKSGTASNGTYSYKTTLLAGSYYYLFFFADTKFASDSTPVQRGPYVGTGGDVPVYIHIMCSTISSDLGLKYSTDGVNWTDIPITTDQLGPIYVSAGTTLRFNAFVKSSNHEFIKWKWYANKQKVADGEVNTWEQEILPHWTEVKVEVQWNYTPQNYTIGGTVLRGDNTPVPGGVDLTLTSDMQTLSQHTDNGNWSFSGVLGGISVTITPSANGYNFSPASKIYYNLKDNYTAQTITAYASDDYVPLTSFLTIPSTVSENSSVSFSWIGTDNKSPTATLQYQYKLDGVDVDWSAWSYDTSKYYDVNNGAYTFWVRAKDEAGNINQAPINYKFVVNAAPKVIAAERINNSVWASCVTLRMPAGASHPTDKFVLLPQHSGINDPELVPIRIHHAGELPPCGANTIIAGQLGLTTRITQTGTGWLVTLPATIPHGGTAQYDIVWGKIKYFGWNEFVTIPDGFPNRNDKKYESCYLDDDLKMWRGISKNDNQGTGTACDDDAFAFMDVANHDCQIIDEKLLRFVKGNCTSGDIGTSTWFVDNRILSTENRICYFWSGLKYVRKEKADENYQKYYMHTFDYKGIDIGAADGEFGLREEVSVPRYLIDNRIWLTGTTKGEGDSDPGYAWFIVLDESGNEIITKTTFDTIQKPQGSYFRSQEAFPIGQNVLLLWERFWETQNLEETYNRQEIAYQIRNTNGQVVKSTTILSPPLLSDSEPVDDEYDLDSELTDNEGKVWIAYSHEHGEGQPIEFYYIVIGPDGNIWKGPVRIMFTPQRDFHFCDKDGYIWATQGAQFFALNPNDTVACGLRKTAFIPNQKVGNIAASVGPDGYRLFDRWSPQIVGIEVPGCAARNSMELYDLNLWDNDLHPANLNIKKGDNVIWSQTGQFTGHTTVDVSGTLACGPNLLMMTQDDFLGGQVLITFPYTIPKQPKGDISNDCEVNYEDLKIMADQWLGTPSVQSADISLPPDGKVNFLDFAVLADHWLEGVTP